MGGIRRFTALSSFVAVLLWSSACELESTGACKLSDGSNIDTYKIFGAWKKVEGYTTPRTPDDLALNFDLLYVELGNRICGVSRVNGAQLPNALFKANYTHDVDKHQVSLQPTGGTVPANLLSYAFTGSCNTTRMIFTYSNNVREVYEIFNRDLPAGSCDPK